MTVSERREYDLDLEVNGFQIRKVLIDAHYERKHADSVSDEIILGLVKQLHGRSDRAVNERWPFRYFVTDMMIFRNRLYKLVWLLEEGANYLGVVNAYRR